MTKPFIALIGYRCTGKSTVGARVAEILEWPFFDADAELETRHSTTIRDIFATAGEADFRDKESAVLADLTADTERVISTGGGCVLRPENRDRLRPGFVVWLTAEPETIWARMQTDPTTGERRPNLTTGGLDEIRELLAEREPLYRETADVILPTDDQSPEMLAASILKEWTSSSATFI